MIFVEAPLVLRIDKFGRITLPKKIRDQLNATDFEVNVKNRRLWLKPVPSWKDLKGAFPKLDMGAFMKERHEEWQ